MIDVFLVADSAQARDALRRLVDSPAMRVAGQGSSFAPDVGASVLLLGAEYLLDDLDSEQTGHQLAIVVLSASGDPEVVSKVTALDPTGWAVVPADSTAEELRAAIVAADAGLAVMPSDLAGSRLAAAASQSGAEASRLSPPSEEDEDRLSEPLTPRERDVLELLSRGLSNREIAGRLSISEHTAKFHVASILGKLGAANRADAVRRGLRQGLVSI